MLVSVEGVFVAVFMRAQLSTFSRLFRRTPAPHPVPPHSTHCTVMHNLQVRFCENRSIYTYCGIVLVAINPYEYLPLFSQEVIDTYKGKTPAEMDPHVFAIAEDAFTCLFRNNKNQSIIVSGESGAGKTVNAKFAMRYFASVGGAANETQIEKKILASNPLMEAIGNAKTTRNDNSSRFGKYIEIIFSDQHEILGANMRTYLLEKSRLVHQSESERNYHIFYQLCANMDKEELEPLELAEADEFVFTNQGGDPVVDDVDDSADFEATKEAMVVLGIEDDVQFELFQILGGLLHLGNVEAKAKNKRSDEAMISDDDSHFPMACALLGLDDKPMMKWMTNRKIQTGKEIFTKPMLTAESKFALHAFAKHIYSYVFDWIVVAVNEKLAPAPPQEDGGKTKKKKKKAEDRTIGVLDIYGFETFAVNSFEQFCINYANEKLQQLFNQHVFKLEQDEYVKEKIQWSFIDFYDNQPCIDLIEDKLGVLGLLDEECKVPKGNDEAWGNKMYKAFAEHSHFEKPRMSNTAFVVKHYACDVQYEVEGFLTKNKDTLYEEHIQMLRDSAVPLLAGMFETRAASPAKAKSGGKSKSQQAARETVGAQFQKSLSALMDTLAATEPHYIRCIKPNDKKEAFAYHNARCIEQLRACGVLETVRISAAGYPSRWTYEEFLLRYDMLADRKKLDRSSARAGCEGILRPLIADEDKYQFGRTKLFFRAGQVAFLEKLRADKRAEAAVMVQKHVRRWRAERAYQEKRTAAIQLQRYIRGVAARKLAQILREARAATHIQSSFRRHTAQKEYQSTRDATMLLQRMVRGHLGRKKFRAHLEHDRAIRLQTSWRKFKQQKVYRKERQDIILVQNAYRRLVAVRELKKRRTEARSVDGVKAKNRELEAKVFELHGELRELRAATAGLKAAEDGRAAALDQVASLTVENEGLKTQLSSAPTAAPASPAAVTDEGSIALADAKARLKAELAVAHATAPPPGDDDEFAQTTSFSPRKGSGGGGDAELEAQLAVANAELAALRHQVGTADGAPGVEASPTERARSGEQIELLTARAAELEKENDRLRVENKELLCAGTSLDTEPNGGADADADADADVGTQLAKAKTDVSRLMLANTKMQERVAEYEKSSVKRANKQLAADVENNETLKESLQEATAKLDEASSVQAEVTAQVAALTGELEQAQGEASTWKAKYDESVTASGTGDIVQKVDALELERAQLKAAVEKSAGDLAASLKTLDAAQAEVAHLKLDNKKVTDRMRNVEGALSKKIGTSGSPTDLLQREIQELVHENLATREKCEHLEDTIKAYVQSGAKLPDAAQAALVKAGGGTKQGTKTGAAGTATPAAPKNSRQGLVQIAKADVQRAVGDMILHLNLRNMKKEAPGVVAHLLFMCILYSDHAEDAELLQTFLARSMGGIKEVVMAHSTDLNSLAFWLSNTFTLLNDMKQFSGMPQFAASKVGVKEMKSFDLSEYRKVLADLLMQIYCTVIKHVEHRINDWIVPGFLDYEPIKEMKNPAKAKQRGGESTVNRVLDYMSGVVKTLITNGVEPLLIQQLFAQIFNFINATMVNNLMLRKDLCHWSSGMQIRHNLAELEEWSQNHSLGNLKGRLVEVTQVCQLLQVSCSANWRMAGGVLGATSCPIYVGWGSTCAGRAIGA